MSLRTEPVRARRDEKAFGPPSSAAGVDGSPPRPTRRRSDPAPGTPLRGPSPVPGVGSRRPPVSAVRALVQGGEGDRAGCAGAQARGPRASLPPLPRGTPAAGAPCVVEGGVGLRSRGSWEGRVALTPAPGAA